MYRQMGARLCLQVAIAIAQEVKFDGRIAAGGFDGDRFQQIGALDCAKGTEHNDLQYKPIRACLG